MLTVTPVQCYSLWYRNKAGDEVCFYAGETAISLEQRLAAHQEAFRAGIHKSAYAALRRKGVTEFWMKPEAGREADVIARLRREGWRLYNDNDGVRSSFKVKAWKEQNDAVFERLKQLENDE